MGETCARLSSQVLGSYIAGNVISFKFPSFSVGETCDILSSKIVKHVILIGFPSFSVGETREIQSGVLNL